MELEVLGSTVVIDEALIGAPPGTIREQVEAYERGDRLRFDLPVTIPDSFTGRVMAAMTDIPPGETRSYGELADELGTAPIAVGGACGRNPVPLLVPCHRVVATDGSLGGYSASGGVDSKRRLLEHEWRLTGGGPSPGPITL